MNIFYVDESPEQAAAMLCDKHVIKMITESAQMLSTCHRVLDGQLAKGPSNSGKRQVPLYTLSNAVLDKTLYKAVHFNHPCNIWLREDISNYMWLVLHLDAMSREYSRRYKGRVHKCDSMIPLFKENFPTNISNKAPTPPAIAMPDDCKVPGNPVQSYRNFYIKYKSRFAKWTATEIPQWFIDGMKNEQQNRNSVSSISALHSNQESFSNRV